MNSIDQQLQQNHEKVFKKLKKYVEYKDFVPKFFKKYIKLPRLNQEDVTKMDN